MKWWQWQGRGEYFAISFYSWGKVAYILMPLRLWNFKGGGPKMQAFCPRIDILKENCWILRICVVPVRRMILENKGVLKLKSEKNVFCKKWSPKLIFLSEFFLKNSIDFWHRKLTLKEQFRHFLTNHNSLQDHFKTIFFEHVDSWAKILHFRTHHL